jgi:hypothetical protein
MLLELQMSDCFPQKNFSDALKVPKLLLFNTHSHLQLAHPASIYDVLITSSILVNFPDSLKSTLSQQIEVIAPFSEVQS